MRNRLYFALFLICITRLFFGQDETTKAQQLLRELKAGNIDTLKELTELGRSDPGVKAYLASQLPAEISDKQHGAVWKAEIQLVGDLQMTAAIPQLVELLVDKTDQPILTGMGRYMTMKDDPPATALIAIGNTTVPAVAELLDSEDRATRSKAIRLLININTSDAQNVLAIHAPTEKDASLQLLIQQHTNTK